MHKHLNVTSVTRFGGIVIRALPVTEFDAGQLQHLAPIALHRLAELKAHLVIHGLGLGLVLMSGYVVLMVWLIAASLSTMRWRSVVRIVGPIAIVAALLIGAGAAAHASDDPTGIWLTQAADARVRIVRCGGELCGTVVWLRESIDPATGRPFTDNKNPDPVLARRPMIGLPLFKEMRSSGPGRWSGHIYNADDGKTYVSNVSVSGPSTLKVEGCIGSLCGSENWTRAR